MQTEIAVQVAWKDKLRFGGMVEGLPHERAIDYYPPLGERAGFTGLETLLPALAGCSGQTVAFLLGKMNPLECLPTIGVPGLDLTERFSSGGV